MFSGLCQLGLLVIALAGNTLDATPTSQQQDDRNQYLFLIQGFKHERERLRSAFVNIDYGADIHSRTGKVERPARDHILYAFDYDRDKVRFDRSRGDRTVKYIRCSSYALVAGMKNKVVESGVVGKLGPEDSPGHLAQFFDLRCLGLLNLSELQREKPFHSFPVVMDAFQSGRFSSAIVQVQEEENGIFAVTKKSGDVELRIWFDTQRGYSPIRIEQVLTPKDTKEPIVLHSCKTEWEQVAGVWIPIRSADIDRKGRKKEMNLRWEKVNEAVPQRMFDLKDFDIESTTLLVDSRVNPPLIEKVMTFDTPIESKSDNTNLRRWLIALNAVIVCLIGLLLVLRQRYKKWNGS